ncbi:hypothetical protein TNCV_2947451 [Trichonephila clavipes]|nr:hypothetical protein TNCV_2947451 [Trichonephila clavipes]
MKAFGLLSCVKQFKPVILNLLSARDPVMAHCTKKFNIRELLRPACAEDASSPLCLHFVSMLVIQPRSGRTYRPQ